MVRGQRSQSPPCEGRWQRSQSPPRDVLLEYLIKENEELRGERDSLQAALRLRNGELETKQREIDMLSLSAEKLEEQNRLLRAQNDLLKELKSQDEQLKKQAERISALEGILNEQSDTIRIRQIMKYFEELIVIEAVGSVSNAKSKKVRLLDHLDQKKIPYMGNIISSDSVDVLRYFKVDGDGIAHPSVPAMSAQEVLDLLRDDEDDDATIQAKQEIVRTMFALQAKYNTTFGVLPLFNQKKK